MRYDYEICNTYIEKREFQRLWLYIQNEGNLILKSKAKRFMVFYKTLKKWIANDLDGNFVAYYLGALGFYKRIDSQYPASRKAGIQDPRTNGIRAENQQFNPACNKNYKPRTMTEDLLIRFDCI